LLNAEEQARRLHAEVVHGFVDVVPDVGHMVHHNAPEAVLAMIGRIAVEAGSPDIHPGSQRESSRR
jgi:pimeloyl-ACP methyl ester carboxylesterase